MEKLPQKKRFLETVSCRQNKSQRTITQRLLMGLRGWSLRSILCCLDRIYPGRCTNFMDLNRLNWILRLIQAIQSLKFLKLARLFQLTPQNLEKPLKPSCNSGLSRTPRPARPNKSLCPRRRPCSRRNLIIKLRPCTTTNLGSQE